MPTEKMIYGATCLTVSRPWGLYWRRGTRLLCSDGRIRSVSYLASTPDTFFSTPAAVRINGVHVTGYATTEEDERGRRVWAFRRHTKFSAALPEWPSRFTPAHDALISLAHDGIPSCEVGPFAVASI